MAVNQFSELQLISAKDIQTILVSVSERTAQKYLTDIKNHYQIKVVTYFHLCDYLKIPKQLYE